MSIFKRKQSLFSSNESSRHSVIFRPKSFSYITSTAKGATVGASLGGILSKIPWFKNKVGGAANVVGLGTLLGGSLGALTEFISRSDNWINRKLNVGKNSVLNKVIELLKESKLKEGVDFTRDPKRANLLKTAVCISVSKDSDDTKLLINTKNDPSLYKLTSTITNSLPNKISQTKKASDKFNDLSITLLSSEADPSIIAKIVIRFIKEGYPVYLIEAGV